jgi:hypothetical protein
LGLARIGSSEPRQGPSAVLHRAEVRVRIIDQAFDEADSPDYIAGIDNGLGRRE